MSKMLSRYCGAAVRTVLLSTQRSPAFAAAKTLPQVATDFHRSYSSIPTDLKPKENPGTFLYHRNHQIEGRNFIPILLVETVNAPSHSTQRLVVTEKSGNIFLIAINRPEKRNCVNEETGQQLLEAVLEFEKDESAKVGVLYGKGSLL
jgi:hypothetical protein